MKRIRLISILIAVIVLGGLAIAILRVREPRYQGRTLSEWMESTQPRPWNAYNNWAYTFSRSPAVNAPTWQPASQAVREIGPDAIPFLLRWTHAKDSSLKSKLISWLWKHPTVHVKVMPADYYQNLAITGFTMLGQEARSAWPTLIKSTHGKDWDERYLAMRCLTASRPDKDTLLPVLLRLTHDPDSRIQSSAAFWIHYRFPSDAETNGINTLFPELKDRPTDRFSTN
jgi:hypothetical protein